MDISRTFWNLHRSSRTFPDPPEPSQILQNLPRATRSSWCSATPSSLGKPSQSDSVIVVLRNPLIAGKSLRTFTDPPEPSQILQNLPRATRSSWCSATPSSPGNREFLMETSSGTFWNLPRSLRTFRTIADPSRTFAEPPEPSQILQNLPRATRSSWSSTTPSLLGSRDGHPWNLLEPSRTFPDPPEPSQIPLEPSGTLPDPHGTFRNLPRSIPAQPPHRQQVRDDLWNLPEPSGTFPDPHGIFQNHHRSHWNFPEPSRTFPRSPWILPEPSRTFPDPPEPSQIPLELSGTFQNLPRFLQEPPNPPRTPPPTIPASFWWGDFGEGFWGILGKEFGVGFWGGILEFLVEGFWRILWKHFGIFWGDFEEGILSFLGGFWGFLGSFREGFWGDFWEGFWGFLGKDFGDFGEGFGGFLGRILEAFWGFLAKDLGDFGEGF
ncbi:proteoglycan 4-like [Zonotrichia leucophrys gambelii]|uniref:proteoglycan 4-like n=1 Tax=Zonotrichia leucophrys gambelii TaxID=257770 RepID=UPI00313FF923